MLTPIVSDMIAAIRSVRGRAKEAKRLGDTVGYYELMADLMALHSCLVHEIEVLEDIQKKSIKGVDN